MDDGKIDYEAAAQHMHITAEELREMHLKASKYDMSQQIQMTPAMQTRRILSKLEDDMKALGWDLKDIIKRWPSKTLKPYTLKKWFETGKITIDNLHTLSFVLGQKIHSKPM